MMLIIQRSEARTLAPWHHDCRHYTLTFFTQSLIISVEELGKTEILCLLAYSQQVLIAGV